MKIERPEDEELKELIESYGPTYFKEKQVYLEDTKYGLNQVKSKGEVFIEVKRADKVLGVRYSDGERYVLPSGRIGYDESLIEGAKRIALEKTNFKVKILRLKEIRRIHIKFSDELVERWNFFFESDIIEKNLDGEFKDIKFLKKVSKNERYPS